MLISKKFTTPSSVICPRGRYPLRPDPVTHPVTFTMPILIRPSFSSHRLKVRFCPINPFQSVRYNLLLHFHDSIVPTLGHNCEMSVLSRPREPRTTIPTFSFTSTLSHLFPLSFSFTSVSPLLFEVCPSTLYDTSEAQPKTPFNHGSLPNVDSSLCPPLLTRRQLNRLFTYSSRSRVRPSGRSSDAVLGHPYVLRA